MSNPLVRVFQGTPVLFPVTPAPGGYATVALSGITLSQGTFFFIGVVGTNHLYLNESGTGSGGLYTQSGNPASNTQPASFNSQGTAVSGVPLLCGTASYQQVVVYTVTTTASTTIRNTAYTTIPINTSNPSLAVFWEVPFFFLMVGAILFTSFGLLMRRIGR